MRGESAPCSDRWKTELDADDHDLIEALVRIWCSGRGSAGMQISRMDLDDAGGNPQRIAEAIMAQIADLPARVPVEDIAYALGIVEIRVEPLKSFEGALITSGPEKAEGSILVNARSGPRRRRYTMGHELGHFLHPHHIPPTDGFHCTSDDMARSNAKGNGNRILQEIEANAFAAELLLPRPLFVRDLQRKRDSVSITSSS